LSKKLADQLSFEQLTALHGKYNEDLTAAEIACRDGVALTAAQCRLKKGDKALAGVVRDMTTTSPPPMSLSGNTTAYTSVEHEQSDGLGFIVILIALAIGIALIGNKLSKAYKANAAARANAVAEANAAAAFRQYQAYSAAHAAAQRAARSRGRYLNG
jgi:hypothetical protein